MKKDKKYDAILKYKLPELRLIEPMTEAQEKVWHLWSKKYNLVLDGAAGAGKSFIALYLALRDIAAGDKGRIIIVRSPQATAEVGFLPGDLDSKLAVYMTPYAQIVNELYGSASAYAHLIKTGVIEFMTTAYVRGISLHNCYVIVDEMQNCTMHELDSIITRAGRNSRYIFCGDYKQSDLKYDRDRRGILEFLEIVQHLKFFATVSFTWSDCVRSGIARDYLCSKEMLYQIKLNEERIARGEAPIEFPQHESEEETVPTSTEEETQEES